MLKPRKRITKQVLKEDKLVTYTFKLNAYIRRNARKISYITLTSIFLIFVISIMYFSKKRSESSAMSEVGIAQLIYESGNFTIAKDAFEELLNKYDGTKGAGIATYYTGDCYYKLKKFEEAKKYFQGYLDDYEDNDILTGSAISGIAACLEEEGEYLQAAEYYKRAAERFPDSFSAPRNLIDMARCYEIAGMKNEAEKGYKKIIEKYSSSIYVREASIMLDLL